MTVIRSADTEEARAAAARLNQARALLKDAGQADFFNALFASALPEEILSVRPARLAALAEAQSKWLGAWEEQLNMKGGDDGKQ
jgi:hypothetical protein